MKDPKISIIIPVYNVKDYLERCVYSAVFQTYENIEVILVDDGSTDGSGLICDELANKFTKVKAYHKENGGLSDARNYGMDRMTGDYFFFIDSDDYIDKRTLSIMYGASISLDVDIVECEFVKVSNIAPVFFYLGSYMVRKDSIRNFIYQNIKWKEHYSTAWNKLYKTSVFGHLRFKKGKINEDEFFVNEWIGNVNYIGYVSAKLYYYLTRADSIMGKPYNIGRVDGIQAYCERLPIIISKYPDTYPDFLAFIVSHSINKIELVIKQGNDSNNKIRKRIASYLVNLLPLINVCNKIGPTNRKYVNDFVRLYYHE